MSARPVRIVNRTGAMAITAGGFVITPSRVPEAESIAEMSTQNLPVIVSDATAVDEAIRHMSFAQMQKGGELPQARLRN